MIPLAAVSVDPDREQMESDTLSDPGTMHAAHRNMTRPAKKKGLNSNELKTCVEQCSVNICFL
jgi:hypothetical protein